MPGRIKLLVCAYLVTVLALGGLIVSGMDESGHLITAAFVLPFAFGTPLGIWAVLSCRKRTFRLFACTAPSMLFAIVIGGWPIVAAFIQMWNVGADPAVELNEPGIAMTLLEWCAISVGSLTIFFETPVLVGVCIGVVGRWRSLEISLGAMASPKRTQFTLRQLLGLTVVAAAALAIRPLLQWGMIGGGSISEVATSGREMFFGILLYACYSVAYSIPLGLLTVTAYWTMLAEESPLRRIIWGLPAALLCGALLPFYFSDDRENLALVSAFVGVLQFLTFSVVRSAGFRLVWRNVEALTSEESYSEAPIAEPALA